MKKILILILSMGSLTATFAQQLQTSSFYDMQGLLHNPAMAGAGEKNLVAATYRTQWSGISGSPKTTTLYGSFALPKYGAGIGGYLFNDVTGPTSRRGLNLDFAKHIVMGNGDKFSLGLEAKFQQYALDKGKLSSSLAADPVLAGSANKMKFDAGFGAAYSGKKLTLGAAVSQLVQSKLDFYSGNLTRTEEARLYRHYYVHGAYKWNVDGVTNIIPNFLMVYLPNAPTEFQGGVTVEHHDLIWWGVSAKVHQSFMVSAGFKINNKFKLGYSFDAYKTPLSTFDGGFNAHEFVMRYEF
jgi:type IX secretion system PorP/SprF family membrane protein